MQPLKGWLYQKFIAFNIKNKIKIIGISSVITQFLSRTICHKILICILAFKIFWNADIYNILAMELYTTWYIIKTVYILLMIIQYLLCKNIIIHVHLHRIRISKGPFINENWQEAEPYLLIKLWKFYMK